LGVPLVGTLLGSAVGYSAPELLFATESIRSEPAVASEADKPGDELNEGLLIGGPISVDLTHAFRAIADGIELTSQLEVTSRDDEPMDVAFAFEVVDHRGDPIVPEQLVRAEAPIGKDQRLESPVFVVPTGMPDGYYTIVATVAATPVDSGEFPFVTEENSFLSVVQGETELLGHEEWMVRSGLVLVDVVDESDRGLP
jgi:hypothetical protein